MTCNATQVQGYEAYTAPEESGWASTPYGGVYDASVFNNYLLGDFQLSDGEYNAIRGEHLGQALDLLSDLPSHLTNPILDNDPTNGVQKTSNAAKITASLEDDKLGQLLSTFNNDIAQEIPDLPSPLMETVPVQDDPPATIPSGFDHNLANDNQDDTNNIGLYSAQAVPLAKSDLEESLLNTPAFIDTTPAQPAPLADFQFDFDFNNLFSMELPTEPALTELMQPLPRYVPFAALPQLPAAPVAQMLDPRIGNAYPSPPPAFSAGPAPYPAPEYFHPSYPHRPAPFFNHNLGQVTPPGRQTSSLDTSFLLYGQNRSYAPVVDKRRHREVADPEDLALSMPQRPRENKGNERNTSTSPDILGLTPPWQLPARKRKYNITCAAARGADARAQPRRKMHPGRKITIEQTPQVQKRNAERRARYRASLDEEAKARYDETAPMRG